MFIHEMSQRECEEVLRRAKVARLACAHSNQPYVIPMHIMFDAPYCYGFTTLGQKVEWMRSNPLVCLEVDEISNDNLWSSVIAFGRYEELPDRPEFEQDRIMANEALQKRALWWEPASLSQEHRDRPHSLTPIVFRLKLNKMTGHRANPDDREGVMVGPSGPIEGTTVAPEHGLQSITIIKAAILYFVIVFGAGFALAPMRIRFAVPLLGKRIAELLEISLMMIVVGFAAKWIVRQFQLSAYWYARLIVGLLAFCLGIFFEFTLVLTLRGLSLTEYFQTGDSVSGAVYFLALLVFALMPLLVRRRTKLA